MTHRQSPCGDSVVGIGDGGKEIEGGVDQLMGLGECETVYGGSAFEQWDSYWEDLTRYEMTSSKLYRKWVLGVFENHDETFWC